MTGLELPRGEFVIPSGVIASTPDIIKRIAREVDCIGAITTKSIGLAEREGYREPILAAVGGSLVNAVGLSNPGIDSFVSEMKGVYPLEKVLITSIFGGTAEEFATLAQKIEKYTDWIELNLSCPHASGYGAAIGCSADLVMEVVSAVKGATDRPVFAKLIPSPGLTGLIARRAVDAGADGITAVNTLGPLAFHDRSGNPLLSNAAGGISGRALRDIALRCVREIRESVSVPIVGMGGISTPDDVAAFRSAGASLFGVGTALAGMSTVQVRDYFRWLAAGPGPAKEGAAPPPSQLASLEHRRMRVREAWGSAMRVLVLDGAFQALPGQFVFVWVPGIGEKPFSLALGDPAMLLVRGVGRVSSAIASLQEGDEILVRGPCGNGYVPAGKACLVGGGSGVAPIYFIANRYRSSVEAAFVGGRCGADLPLCDDLAGLVETYQTTEDGSAGERGLVTDAMASRLPRYRGREFFNCGPEAMLLRAAELESRVTVPEKIFFSVERYTKCGIGLCGSCALDGYRTCVDGPVFPYEVIKAGDFTKCKRSASGRRVPFNA